MTGHGTYDDRTATREPCVCGRLVTRRAQCPVWRGVEQGHAISPEQCPLPPRGSHLDAARPEGPR